MKVIKFGGTSVGSANSILSVKRIVEASKRTGNCGSVCAWAASRTS